MDKGKKWKTFALFSSTFLIGGLYPLSYNLMRGEMILEKGKESALFSTNFLIWGNVPALD